MAGVAIGAVIDVTSYADVHVVHIGLVVADQTGEDRSISRIGVAGGTVGP